ncbi:DUF3027 domain-containing protein [Actinokineospora sp. PR83]|uniref:DUF3027 domain-containing protein n=1 Tax=Actinokineospora sp. PR83 TaxID=2884908 RepID=UPI001F16A955|nr:DUF3027 domain-containing protein [Actinokineospora sp. PR83]MCG8916771.1 DUF3027 domain-containing protein [Actinokineospora sp. PR83]
MTSTRAPEADTDPALIAAVGIARAAAREQAGADVGEHVAVAPEDAAAATHLFEAELPGYLGWRWAVTVANGGPGTEVTVSEVVLLPGPDALVAPQWVPWHERVRPGDMGVGDLLPTAPDDDRLVPGYAASDDPAIEALAVEVGLGRPRVLSREGRLDAADRWKTGDFGPGADMARGAPAHCGTCGFYAPVAGSLGAAFGVCANEIAPADGRVVHAEYGCGAHSEAEVEQVSPVLVAELMYDDSTLDVEITPRTGSSDSAAPDSAASDSEVPDGEQLAEVAEVPAVDEAAPAEATDGPAEVSPEAEAVLDAADTTPTATIQPTGTTADPAGPGAPATAADPAAAGLAPAADAAEAPASAGDPVIAAASAPESSGTGTTTTDPADAAEQAEGISATAADPAVAEEAPAATGPVEAPVSAGDPVIAAASAPESSGTGAATAEQAGTADVAAAEQATPDHAIAVDALDPTPAEPVVDPASPVDDRAAGAPTGSTEPAPGDGPVDPAAAVAPETAPDSSTDQAVAAVAQGEVSADGSGQPEPDDRG